MTDGDYLTMAGLFLAAWASGWVSGWTFKTVRQVIERATGFGGG